MLALLCCQSATDDDEQSEDERGPDSSGGATSEGTGGARLGTGGRAFGGAGPDPGSGGAGSGGARYGCENPEATDQVDGFSAQRSDIGVRQITSGIQYAAKLAQDPNDGELYILQVDGTVSRLDLETGDLDPVINASDLQDGLGLPVGVVHGMTIGPEGNLYLVVNSGNATTSRATIVRGVRQGDSFALNLVATTASYPKSNTPFDHNFNGILVSDDGETLYVNSGSRTDHGETHAGEREVPLTAKMFRLPADANNILLENDRTALLEAGVLFAEGLRNSFDPTWDSEGRLVSADNGPDSDYSEELNWIREGLHYGFPWRLGAEENALQDPAYDPETDPRLHPGFYGTDEGLYSYDPGLADGRPASLEDPILSVGPDADSFRDPETGDVEDASALGASLSTFTAHRSMLGLSYDRARVLCPDFAGDGFILSWGGAVPIDDMPDADGQDLHHLDVVEDGASFSLRTTRLVSGFERPIDSVLVENRLYVLEYDDTGDFGRVLLVTLPLPVLLP